MIDFDDKKILVATNANVLLFTIELRYLKLGWPVSKSNFLNYF